MRILGSQEALSSSQSSSHLKTLFSDICSLVRGRIHITRCDEENKYKITSGAGVHTISIHDVCEDPSKYSVHGYDIFADMSRKRIIETSSGHILDIGGELLGDPEIREHGMLGLYIPVKVLKKITIIIGDEASSVNDAEEVIRHFWKDTRLQYEMGVWSMRKIPLPKALKKYANFTHFNRHDSL